MGEAERSAGRADDGGIILNDERWRTGDDDGDDDNCPYKAVSLTMKWCLHCKKHHFTPPTSYVVRCHLRNLHRDLSWLGQARVYIARLKIPYAPFF